MNDEDKYNCCWADLTRLWYLLSDNSVIDQTITDLDWSVTMASPEEETPVLESKALADHLEGVSEDLSNLAKTQIELAQKISQIMSASANE